MVIITIKIDNIMQNMKDDLVKRMEGAIKSLHHDLKGLRTGRASPSLLDSVVVEAYGDRMPIAQLANVTVQDPKLLSVQVWDATVVKAIEKAINAADLGVTASADGQLIRVPIPQLNEERRREMVKVAHKFAENARIAVRNVRRDGVDLIKKMEKDQGVSQDEIHKEVDEVQKLTDEYIKKIDQALAEREKEIMHI
jgi:ribosome recycling factor